VTVTYADGRQEVRSPESFEKGRPPAGVRELLGQLHSALRHDDRELAASLERRLDYAILGKAWTPP
jgi:hypothetical protein